MRYALLFCFALLGAATLLAAPVPKPTVREAAVLIDKLGSEDYLEREAATKRLDELGLLALTELRVATQSENAEIADRAKDLVRKIERRASNDRAIAASVVELNAKDAPLDDVLADLSKQVGFEVVVGGANRANLAQKKISVETAKVSFWAALLKVCATADLQIAGAGGYYAPGSVPYNAVRATADGTALRIAANPRNAVVVEAREGKKRPASVHGGVLVEAFEVPAVAASRNFASAVLQLWPEPKLGWQSTADVKVTRATDAKGDKLVPELAPAAPVQVQKLGGGKVTVVKNADGTFTVVNPDATNPLAVGGNFAPNTRQGLVRLKTGVEVATEITGSVFGVVRSAPEPLAVVGLNAKEETHATGPASTEVTAELRTDDNGKQFALVKLTYDPLQVHPARTGDELPDVKLTPSGNATVHGLRITDADGKAFSPSLASAENDFDPTRRGRIILDLKLELPAVKDGPTVPTKLVFWGTYAKPVAVPYTLKNVPLAGGTK